MNKSAYYATSIRLSLLSLIMLFFGGVHPVNAAGELMVAPTRVVFDMRTRTAQVNLVNTSSETSTFRIEFKRRRMTETGSFVEVKEAMPGELFADTLVRFSPRQVTLAPGQSQVIRLVLRKPANLAAGEYRSHLLFRSIPSVGGSSVEGAGDGQQEFNVQLVPVLGISIPVIVRHGKTDVDVKLTNIVYQSGEQPKVGFKLQRDGEQSVYGDLTATFISDSGERWVLGKANGVAVYTPNAYRHFELPLHLPAGVTLANGRLQINYQQNPKDGNKQLAEGTVSIP